jgi:hypothetical protein
MMQVCVKGGVLVGAVHDGRTSAVVKKWLGAIKAASCLQTPHEHNEKGA